jgi:hypothetical protein
MFGSSLFAEAADCGDLDDSDLSKFCELPLAGRDKKLQAYRDPNPRLMSAIDSFRGTKEM